MSRILARLGLVVASLALMLSMAPQAHAQVDESLAGVDADGDDYADVSIDRDPIGDGVHFILPNPVASEGGTGGGDAEAGLAYTGTDVEPIVAASLGLLAVGGSALVVSRRRLSAIES